MATGTATSDLLAEMRRTLGALESYVARHQGYSRESAAARRATLDLSRALVAWRKAPVPIDGVK